MGGAKRKRAKESNDRDASKIEPPRKAKLAGADRNLL
jgi:hypothetical protein